MGQNDALVFFAKKYQETARYIINQPIHARTLNCDGIIDIVTSYPSMANEILANEVIMEKINENEEA